MKPRLLCLLLSTLTLFWQGAAPAGPAETVPAFKLPDLDNQPVELRQLLEKGPVLIDFWATWCKPCIKFFPELQSLHEKYRARGLTVVGINEDGPRSLAKVKPFTRSLKVDFTILVDENSEVMRKLRVQALPTTLLIAPDGTIAFRHSGYTAETMKELEAKIIALLPKESEEQP